MTSRRTPVASAIIERGTPVSAPAPGTGADDLRAVVRRTLEAGGLRVTPGATPGYLLVNRPTAARPSSPPGRGRSAAERWAHHVLRACEADGDLKTLATWATFVGVSYSSLCECCRLIDIRPSDARDLARLLRAVARARHSNEDPAALLDVSDRRTLRALLRRANLGMHPAAVTIEQFLDRQRFVTAHNSGLIALRRLIDSAR